MSTGRFLRTVALGLGLSSASVCVAQMPEHVRHPLAERPELAAALAVLDAWVEATVAQREQPGLSMGIVYDQALIWAKGYGDADLAKRVPATPTTLYRIASISKLFTATAIMQLRDAGKLQLDDRVVTHLPWFAIHDTFPDDREITISAPPHAHVGPSARGRWRELV